jgi:hypothetical protein
MRHIKTALLRGQLRATLSRTWRRVSSIVFSERWNSDLEDSDGSGPIPHQGYGDENSEYFG